MEEGNKYKMAAHIKPGIGLLPGDGGIEAFTGGATFPRRCRSHRRPKGGGGGLERPAATPARRRHLARLQRRASRRPGPGPPLPAGTVAALSAPSPVPLRRHGGLQVGVRGGVAGGVCRGALGALSPGEGGAALP